MGDKKDENRISFLIDTPTLVELSKLVEVRGGTRSEVLRSLIYINSPTIEDEDRLRLRRFDQLTNTERWYLRERYIENRSCLEIASKHRVNPKSVRALLHRAVMKVICAAAWLKDAPGTLKEVFGKEEEGDDV